MSVFKLLGTKKPWATWVQHGVIAAAIAYVLSFVVTPLEASALAVWGYAFREADQQLVRAFKRQQIHVLDTIMDVVAPIVTCTAVWWWLT